MIDRPPLAARGQRHVFLRDMVLAASIGVYPHERQAPQRVRINIDLGVAEGVPGPGIGLSRSDLSRPGVGRDELDRVVDYERLANTVRAAVASGHVQLVETLAERLAEACFEDGRVTIARVRVEKLDVFADLASVGVEIERERDACPRGAIDS